MFNDASFARAITCRISMEKATFNKKKPLFNRKLDLNLRKKISN